MCAADIQARLGHWSIASNMVYAAVTNERRRRPMRRPFQHFDFAEKPIGSGTRESA